MTVEGGAADKGVLVRRLAHFAIALAPLYYLLPVQLPFIGVRRWVLLIAFFASVAAFEHWRHAKGVTFLGLRPHERWAVASFLWAAAGITIVLWMFPHELASASLVAMAVADPLAGELRRHGKGLVIVVSLEGTTYLLLAFAVLVHTGPLSLASSLLLALVGAIVAVPAECIKTRYVDDDFSMLVLPAIAMTLVAGLA